MAMDVKSAGKKILSTSGNEAERTIAIPDPQAALIEN